MCGYSGRYRKYRTISRVGTDFTTRIEHGTCTTYLNATKYEITEGFYNIYDSYVFRIRRIDQLFKLRNTGITMNYNCVPRNGLRKYKIRILDHFASETLLNKLRLCTE